MLGRMGSLVHVVAIRVTMVNATHRIVMTRDVARHDAHKQHLPGLSHHCDNYLARFGLDATYRV
jgi:hypothetical protein